MIGRITPAGQVTEFVAQMSSPDVITAGPDGNLWFGSTVTLTHATIGHITPDGQVTTYVLPDTSTSIAASVTSLTAGPDGNVWFTATDYPRGEKVGRITPTGQITEFSIPIAPGVVGSIGGITRGPDGNLWFEHDGIVAHISPTGAFTDHVVDNLAGALTTGPDGNLWMASTLLDLQTGATLGDAIERIGVDGSVTTFHVNAMNSALGTIQAGPDGNLYFTAPDANQIDRITTAGQITLFTAPTAGSRPTAITAGPNGNVWFTEAGSQKIGEFLLVGTPPAPPAATTTTLALDVKAPSVGQSVHLTATVNSAAGTPGGTVTFFDGRTVLGTANLNANGQAVFPTVFRTAGNHSLIAQFNGTAALAASGSAALPVTVSQTATTTRLTASANPVRVGQTLTLRVAVTGAFAGAEAPTGTLILRDGTNVIAIAHLDATGHAVLTFIPGKSVRTTNGTFTVLPRGTHHLTVSYLGDGNIFASVSAVLDLTVV
jgi:streptogramin lyase